MSPYEILVHLNEKILTGDLVTFESLKRYTSLLPDGTKYATILKKAFDLQRRLYWGFFKDVSPETYPKVWSQVVIQDRDYPFGGDLKRYMSIQGVYLCMIDIHGYTRYCHEHRQNMSMLDLLDRMLQVDVPMLAAQSRVISKRAHGDEILLLGTSASDILEAVLRIVSYFSKRKRLEEGPPGKAGIDIMLPEFFMSAGIAGGQSYASFIITRDGDVSGDIVNTAARLQARANAIAPNTNKILLTSQVYQKLKGSALRDIDGINTVDFFNANAVEFKGVNLSVYEIIFLETEAFRISYRDVMEELYAAIDKSMWKSKIFELAMDLATRLATNMPTEARSGVDSKSLVNLIKCASEFFATERYEKALAAYAMLTVQLSNVPGIDGLAIEYMQRIGENYSRILGSFVSCLDCEVEQNLKTMYGQKELENFMAISKHHAMYDELRDSARLRIRGRKAIWFREADKIATELSIRIQSRK
ncbi:hypothetical protein MASR2M48_28770 [Spirochaetota bacterium]